MYRSKKIDHINVSRSQLGLYVTTFGDHFETQVIFFHDLGEYHDRYSEFAEYLFHQEIGTTFIDMRGHGLSSGSRGHASSYKDLLEDYETFFDQRMDNYKEKKVFLCGHGLGALICMSLDQIYSHVEGMILINPAIQYRDLPDLGLKKILGKRSLLDKFKIPLPSGIDALSNEQVVVSNNKHDPLVNKKMTVGMYRSINELLKRIKYSSYFINVPVLYIIGEEDKIVDLDISRLFSSSIDGNLLMLKNYKNLGHEVFNELEKDIVFKDIKKWIRLTESSYVKE
ncbi:MAG: alpha/beta fold hydrolase [Bdellovibrionota bacterium]|nr:alpha/beta fold hydrolase [Bdellovibrionota bacterium]